MSFPLLIKGDEGGYDHLDFGFVSDFDIRISDFSVLFLDILNERSLLCLDITKNC